MSFSQMSVHLPTICKPHKEVGPQEPQDPIQESEAPNQGSCLWMFFKFWIWKVNLLYQEP